MNQTIKIILIAAFLAIVFCVSFVYLYAVRQRAENSPTAEVEKKFEEPLPNAKLVDLNSELLSDDELRNGKVILMFLTPECEACKAESEFLKTLDFSKKEVKIFGVTSFGKPKETLEASQSKFPFRVLFDADSELAIGLGIRKVPIKIYVENGVIKKVWGGATINETKKREFMNWLENV